MSNLSISKAWEESKAIAVRDGRLIAAVALALVLLPEVIFGVIAPPPTLSGEAAPAWATGVSLIVALIGVVGQIAIIKLALGPATSVGESIMHGFKRVLPAIAALCVFVLPLAAILVALLVAVGGSSAIESMGSGTLQPGAAGLILLFVVIVFAISIRFQMVVPVATAETSNPIEILKRSWELTRGHYWRLLGFLLVALVFAVVLLLFAQIIGGILGRIAFGDTKPLTIGALVVALISAAAQAAFTCLVGVMLARIYVQLSGRGVAGVPNSGT
jgi:hypothetical protein